MELITICSVVLIVVLYIRVHTILKEKDIFGYIIYYREANKTLNWTKWPGFCENIQLAIEQMNKYEIDYPSYEFIIVYDKI